MTLTSIDPLYVFASVDTFFGLLINGECVLSALTQFQCLYVDTK